MSVRFLLRWVSVPFPGPFSLVSIPPQMQNPYLNCLTFHSFDSLVTGGGGPLTLKNPFVVPESGRDLNDALSPPSPPGMIHPEVATSSWGNGMSQ